MNKFLFLIVIYTICISGCSYEQLYNALQELEQNLCETGPSANYEECIKESDEDYKDYERKRNGD